MNKKKQQSKLRTVHSSASDSDAEDNPLQPPRSASDIISSFLSKRKQAVDPSNIPKFRSASDVINSFLQSKKSAKQPNFQSALDVINSYLHKNETASEATGRKSKRKRKKGKIIETSNSDSDSPNDDAVAAKKRKISRNALMTNCDYLLLTELTVDRNVVDISSDELHRQSPEMSIDRGESRCSSAVTQSATNDHIVTSTSTDCNLSKHCVQQVTLDSPTVDVDLSSNLCNADLVNCSLSNEKVNSICDSTEAERSAESGFSNNVESSSALKKSKPLKKRQLNPKPKKTKALLKRAVPDKTDKTKQVIKYKLINLIDYKIPKSKFDRAMELLNSDENRYDETPANYITVPVNDMYRGRCERRRFAEATYDHASLRKLGPSSSSRILSEMENCLKTENWKRMAELIYFGCDVVPTDEARKMCGTTFFTYALLLLIMDSNPSSISTLDGKRDEIMKYFTSLGAEEEECEQFLVELNLLTKDAIATTNSKVCDTQQG